MDSGLSLREPRNDEHGSRRDRPLAVGLQPERGGEQGAGVFALRILEQLGGRPLLLDLAGFHHDQMARERGHHAQIVRDEHVGEFALALQVAQQIDHLRLEQHVERRGRLVQHDKAGFQHQGAGDGDALALATGKLMGVAVPPVWIDTDLFQCLDHQFVAFPAVADVVNRQSLADVIDQGTTFPATTGIHPGSPFHNPDTEHYGAGVEAAQQRLADAGIDPSSISFAVDYIPPAQLAYAEYIVQVLGDIGFDAELNTVPDFPSWATRVAGGEHQMTINNVWNWGDPVIGVHRTYLSTNNVGVIWTNNTGYNNADVDALLAQAGAEYDFDTRVDLYGQAQEIISQDVPIVYLTTPPFWQAFQPRVQNPPIGIWGQLGPMHEVWLAE